MENAGIRHGGKVTMARDGCTSTERAAAVSTGTLMRSKTHGTKNSHIMDFTIALRILSSSAMLRSHPSNYEGLVLI